MGRETGDLPFPRLGTRSIPIRCPRTPVGPVCGDSQGKIALGESWVYTRIQGGLSDAQGRACRYRSEAREADAPRHGSLPQGLAGVEWMAGRVLRQDAMHQGGVD